METENYFNLSVNGQIESAHFPMGPESKTLFCRYDIVYGDDWEVCSGLKCGVTQCADSSRSMDEIVFNMPIEICFKSTNPFGWPQIVLSFYGSNWWGIETCKGYARVFIPPSCTSQPIIVPIFTPKCTNIWSAFFSWITDRNPELRDPKILVDAIKCKGLFTETYGEVHLSFNTISRGREKLSLDWSV